jgi:signal transduction histidine kinase
VAARHRDGSPRWFALEVEPVAHRGRSLSVAVLHDITPRKLAESELERAHGELELFSARVAHDLRGPLHNVQGFAHLLQEHAAGALDDEAQGYLGQILRTVEQADRLIGKLLDLSRLGRAELQRCEVELDSLARSIAGELLTRRPAQRVVLLIEPGLRARCDAALVCVLLANLLDNAIKFGGARDPLHLEVGSVLCDGELALFVRDDGPGFDAAAAGELFNPFVRLDTSRGVEGTGLGLATARRIVERHGGRLWVESAPGQGATFFFTLG